MGRLLGGFEKLLMFAVLELDQTAHSVAIRRLILERTGRQVSPGAIHTGLDRLERRGMVVSWTGETTSGRGGRPRRYYRLDPAGAKALREAHEAVLRMAAGMESKLTEALASGSEGSGS